jgi:hypothetical protein
MSQITEKMLDKAIEQAFMRSKDFADWFLSRTKFAGSEAVYHWSRSDHPWCCMSIPTHDPHTGATGFRCVESETDILVVFRRPDSTRFALHIENKLASGAFTRDQPDLYAARARYMAGKIKYGDYSDFETVLIAPQKFSERWPEGCAKFDCYVSHEDISAHLPHFGRKDV